MTAPVAPAQVERRKPPGISLRLFVVVLLLLMVGAIVRSAIANQPDGFTIDEAYHIAVGVSYAHYADFRINPEQPPLVKLWVGSFMSATGFHVSSIRPFAYKADERESSGRGQSSDLRLILDSFKHVRLVLACEA